MGSDQQGKGFRRSASRPRASGSDPVAHGKHAGRLLEEVSQRAFEEDLTQRRDMTLKPSEVQSIRLDFGKSQETLTKVFADILPVGSVEPPKLDLQCIL